MADTTAPVVAPALYTAESHIFEADTAPAIDASSLPQLTEDEIVLRYEIERTVEEIRQGMYKRIALQFPDDMLVDAPRVFDCLGRRLAARRKQDLTQSSRSEQDETEITNGVASLSVGADSAKRSAREGAAEKLFILGDTSYGACCVDEIAAEHADAEVVVHYGRSCLSPTARLPVIYVFTTRELDLPMVTETFKEAFPEKEKKVVLMADIPYSTHLPALSDRLREAGYLNIYATEVIHDPSSPLPNRTVPDEVRQDTGRLREYALFHISEPPQSLLLTLSSRVNAIHIYPTDQTATSPPKALVASTAMALRRRYALLTQLSTVSIFGILINTLSVKNYMHVLDQVRAQIEAAGKKSYTFVVGKINAAKVANFSEVGGWVVIGCWESSLIESKDFWKPIITPFELRLALQGDAERVWTGEWTSDFQAVLADKERGEERVGGGGEDRQGEEAGEAKDEESEEESAPPEFDLRTGRYVSHSRPMFSSSNSATPSVATSGGAAGGSQSLMKRANGDMAQIGGVVSPGAEFLRSQRTWRGLGSDFEVTHETDSNGQQIRGAAMEEGRSGLARGYVVGDDRSRT